MTRRNMTAKTERFYHDKHTFWWVSKLFPCSSVYGSNICLPFWQLKILQCAENHCAGLEDGDHVYKREIIWNYDRRAYAHSMPRLFALQHIICNKNSNQSNISSKKNTYKTWMHHHNFGLAISTSKELAVTSYTHPDGTSILLATLFLMDLKRKPTQAVWLQFRTCSHLGSLLQRNVQKWRKMEK